MGKWKRHKGKCKHRKTPKHGQGGTKITPAPSVQNHKRVKIYLGNGCFWERQYAYANIEIKIGKRPCEEASGTSVCLWKTSFNRDWLKVTARVGYAGGSRVPSNGRVCYHHHTSSGDDLYSDYGHAEVVQVVLDDDNL